MTNVSNETPVDLTCLNVKKNKSVFFNFGNFSLFACLMHGNLPGAADSGCFFINVRARGDINMLMGQEKLLLVFFRMTWSCRMYQASIFYKLHY